MGNFYWPPSPETAHHPTSLRIGIQCGMVSQPWDCTVAPSVPVCAMGARGACAAGRAGRIGLPSPARHRMATVIEAAPAQGAARAGAVHAPRSCHSARHYDAKTPAPDPACPARRQGEHRWGHRPPRRSAITGILAESPDVHAGDECISNCSDVHVRADVFVARCIGGRWPAVLRRTMRRSTRATTGVRAGWRG